MNKRTGVEQLVDLGENDGARLVLDFQLDQVMLRQRQQLRPVALPKNLSLFLFLILFQAIIGSTVAKNRKRANFSELLCETRDGRLFQARTSLQSPPRSLRAPGPRATS